MAREFWAFEHVRPRKVERSVCRSMARARGSMHLGLARAQLLPRSDGYRLHWVTTDALVYLVG